MFGIHVTKWAVFPDDDPTAFPARVASAGADSIGFLHWRETDADALAAACNEQDVKWVSTAAGEAAGNTGHEGPAMTDPDCHNAAIDTIIETCECVGEYVDNVVVTVGPDQQCVDEAIQQRAIVDVLRTAAPAAAAADVTLVVEPLNVRVDHPGYFLTTTDRGIEIVDAVDHEHVQLLYDVYHQQITEGDILARIREYHDRIGMYHVAGVPGRSELGPDELDWTTIFRTITEIGYEGTVGLEYVPQGDPDETVADAVAIHDRVA
ncbi:hydroxypyruvate isomerase [Halogeometricum pallidum JCM 14848]|uniref:Hydroxypyruvate isomerase n=1 Tax=Halogeometricum pallidum JCM 14848 TaxID=1227487 RepID=M0DCU9_HALPD|nr:TIM barrel protein [Halogeometricum pallidum]ELZ32633.1 hydroxypyruvate isomerase [Halogeometricum pallidum JCM 14848]